MSNWSQGIERVEELGPPAAVHGDEVLRLMAINFALFMGALCGHTALISLAPKLESSCVLVLSSLQDVLISLLLPFIILELMLNHWIFGQTLCQLFWFLESLARLSPPLLRLGLAAGLILPPKHWRFSIPFIIFLLLFAVGLSVPPALSAQTLLQSSSKPIPDEGAATHVRFVRRKCQVPAEAQDLLRSRGWLWASFLLSFFLPGLGSLALLPLAKKKHSKIALAASATLLLLSFPYWIVVALTGKGIGASRSLLWMAHMGPRGASALSWLFLLPLALIMAPSSSPPRALPLPAPAHLSLTILHRPSAPLRGGSLRQSPRFKKAKSHDDEYPFLSCNSL